MCRNHNPIKYDELRYEDSQCVIQWVKDMYVIETEILIEDHYWINTSNKRFSSCRSSSWWTPRLQKKHLSFIITKLKWDNQCILKLSPSQVTQQKNVYMYICSNLNKELEMKFCRDQNNLIYWTKAVMADKASDPAFLSCNQLIPLTCCSPAFSSPAAHYLTSPPAYIPVHFHLFPDRLSCLFPQSSPTFLLFAWSVVMLLTCFLGCSSLPTPLLVLILTHFDKRAELNFQLCLLQCRALGFFSASTRKHHSSSAT